MILNQSINAIRLQLQQKQLLLKPLYQSQNAFKFYQTNKTQSCGFHGLQDNYLPQYYMIIKIYKKGDSKPQQYKFSQTTPQVVVGRNPKCENDNEKIVVDEASASRTHLAIKLKNSSIMAMDLGSSNGTKINEAELEPNKWVRVQPTDQIVLGQSEGKIVVNRQQNNKSKSQSESERSSSSESRSREKKTKKSFEDLCKELKISDSSLKMLKQMASEKKSKEDKIKFLKLMGCKNVDSHWEEIEDHLKKQNKYNNNSKKAADELQKQFDSGRSGFEKKGLGRK